MPAVTTFTIEPDELLGLSALAALEKPADRDAGTVAMARSLMHTALTDRLTEAGLPWAPSAEAVRRRAAGAGAETARTPAGDPSAGSGGSA